MRRVLYFDTFNGVSGDMILGALVDLGLPLEHLRSELTKLKVEGYEIKAEKVERQGIQGTNLRVELNRPGHDDHEAHHDHGHHDHEHHEHGQHRHEHHHHEGDEHHEHQHGRGFTQIRQLIEEAELDPWVKANATLIFRRLGEAEAKVHQTSIEEVHFHEVGAVDSIVDIVGACIGFRYFEIEQFYTGPLNFGSGTVTFSHGTWPVPTPATSELTRGFPAFVSEVSAELTTPTGAAIVTTLAEQSSSFPICYFDEWGFGAGDARFEKIPNMLRLFLGHSPQPIVSAGSSAGEAEGWHQEEVSLLEANIDDMDAEMFGHFLELALKKGALDVYYTPIQMKKSRPGLKVSLLCRGEDLERMTELFFHETTTFGVRWSPLKRWILDREMQQLETEYGTVGVKIGRLRGQIVSISPEYEDLKAIADRADIPLKMLRQKVIEQIVAKSHE